jgi:hypothetical protein
MYDYHQSSSIFEGNANSFTNAFVKRSQDFSRGHLDNSPVLQRLLFNGCWLDFFDVHPIGRIFSGVACGAVGSLVAVGTRLLQSTDG